MLSVGPSPQQYCRQGCDEMKSKDREKNKTSPGNRKPDDEQRRHHEEYFSLFTHAVVPPHTFAML
jgi:hypothetical protein